jgi:hypothetical protein
VNKEVGKSLKYETKFELCSGTQIILNPQYVAGISGTFIQITDDLLNRNSSKNNA